MIRGQELILIEDAAIRAQQVTIDRILDVLESGGPLTAKFTICYRDERQRLRMLALRDRLHPPERTTKRGRKG